MRKCLKYTLNLNVNENNRAIMKNNAIVLVLLLMAGFVGYGQSPRYGDTIDAENNMDLTYFSNFSFEEWFDSIDTVPRSRVICEPGDGGRPGYTDYIITHYIFDSLYFYFYTDRPIEITGIAVAVRYASFWDTDPSIANDRWSDTLGCKNAGLVLYDAMPGSFAFRAGVPMPPDLSVPHRYLRLPLNTRTTTPLPCTGRVGTVDRYVPVYEQYFSSPVVVEDSFYLGMNICSLNPDMSWFPQWAALLYQLLGNNYGSIERWDNLDSCERNLPHMQYRGVHTNENGEVQDVMYLRHIAGRYLIFPIIVPDTGCASVAGLTVAEADSGRARLTWNRRIGHTLWEVSYGPEGVSADAGTVVTCSDTTTVLERIESGMRYWAYVRAVCERRDSTYYSGWTGPVEIYIPVRHTVVAEANYAERGRVDGGGVYEEGEEAVLSARAWRPYIFLKWNDGDSTNPRRIVVTQDTSFTAVFTNLEGIVSVDSLGGDVWLLPNPAKDRVRVQSRIGLKRVEIYDTQGRSVLSQTAEGNAAELDISQWAAGSYVVLVHTERGSVSKRMMVE